VHETDVADGLEPDGLVLVNAEEPPDELDEHDVRCVPATRLASENGSGFVNLIMVGAAGAALGEPPLEELQDAAVELLGRKADAGAVRGAVAVGYRWPR
jgi:Pyruvate/2-oxoacid:ferredoxin oxidoreductase gamma subunit